MRTAKSKEHARRVLAHYDELAAIYDSRWLSYLDSSHDWALERLQQLHEGARVIDLACGTGLLLERLYNLRPDLELVGIDGSAAMLEVARRRLPHIELRQQNIDGTQAREEQVGQFDAVLSMSVLHHLKHHDAHLSLIHSLARMNGMIILCDFAINTLMLQLCEYWWRLTHTAHNRAYRMGSLAKKFRASDHFMIVESELLEPNRFWRIQAWHLKSQ
jgi:2-polyprenyl-3-methyl-5-hydroxy-6-metoxy-1,4-benzoquinol methylase